MTYTTQVEALEERYCFICRERRPFNFITHIPTDIMSYAEPSFSVRCGACASIDGDCFPGRSRSWDIDE